MNVNSGLGKTEYWFIAIFFILYLIYLGRVFWIARRLKTTARSSILKFFLRSAYFGLMILALLNPSFGELNEAVKAENREIFFVVDVSKSMDATDIQPSRVEKAKFEINRVISQFPYDRIGIIVFSEEPFLLSPLTFDKNAISLFVPKINTNLLLGGGSLINPALEMAYNRLQKSKSKNKSKTIVLVSDGEFSDEYDRNIIGQIKQHGINFFSVGIGTTKGTTIKDGNSFKKDNDGNIVITKLDNTSLKKITNEAKGKYLEISSISNSLTALITEISQIKSTFSNNQQINVVVNKYFYFLIIALFLLGIDVFFTVRTFQL
ncbi:MULTISPECIES: VWA domain-containing protein [unclassified Arcicella]|uniref:vWA domain-containing protein n=1 Tax=unclassified Arcicella TaxID=2644986 RepID=UPI0028594731|nr:MULTISPECIES: VWA domain-containing protein [unclassified Arcicella]MDR6562581.1 Ca-activated chloride channel family protein [Arcicella sp. BE51]MDR6812668.1 Ca-activated chloride channel family protein [Arcicella sp. BE140]MDR6823980.1 Ca-activated chloride channel family protein [Arcicella sp. BE139]